MSAKSTSPPSVPDHYGMSPEDYQRLGAMTDADIAAAVAADPDAAPLLTPERAAHVRSVSLAKLVRLKVPMTQAQFSKAYGIPLAKLAAWERNEAEPTETEQEYLRLISRDPERAKERTPEINKLVPA